MRRGPLGKIEVSIALSCDDHAIGVNILHGENRGIKLSRLINILEIKRIMVLNVIRTFTSTKHLGHWFLIHICATFYTIV